MLLANVNINLDLSVISFYLSGILTGLILAVLLYVLLVLLTLNKKKKIIEASEDNISEEELRLMIERARENYNILRKSDDENIASSAYKKVVFTLISDIATKCFPKSKKPMYELSVDEALLLGKYTIQRIDELLDTRGLRLFRRLSMVTVSNVLTAKKKVDNNKIVKEIKKYSGIVKVGLTISNVLLAPAKLVKKGAQTTKAFIMNKILMITIGIVGEEAYKIYTKQAMKSVDPEFIKLQEEVMEDLIKLPLEEEESLQK